MAVDYLGQRVRGGGLDCRLNPVLLVRAELWKLGALAGPSGRDEAGEDGSLRTGGCDGHDVRQDALKPRHFPIRACREHPLHIDAEHSACLAGARSGSSLTRVYSRIPLIGAVLPPWPRLSVLPSATKTPPFLAKFAVRLHYETSGPSDRTRRRSLDTHRFYSSSHVPRLSRPNVTYAKSEEAEPFPHVGKGNASERDASLAALLKFRLVRWLRSTKSRQGFSAASDFWGIGRPAK